MGFKSNMSGIIAKQVGNLQGKLTAQIEGNISDILRKFSNECPPQSELENIIKTKNNLMTALNSFEKRIVPFRDTVNAMQATINGAKVAIEAIKAIPIPTAIIPPMSGGVGLPISILTRYSDALIKLNKIVDTLENDIEGVGAVLEATSNSIAQLNSRLKTIDTPIQNCSKNNPQILAAAQPPENTGSEGTPNADYLYKGYTLEIVQDRNSPKISPRRYAIAKDKEGLERLRGESSFSSDTQVLLDEIKFKIDNQFT